MLFFCRLILTDLCHIHTKDKNITPCQVHVRAWNERKQVFCSLHGPFSTIQSKSRPTEVATLEIRAVP